jgi:hypothetical protein
LVRLQESLRLVIKTKIKYFLSGTQEIDNLIWNTREREEHRLGRSHSSNASKPYLTGRTSWPQFTNEPLGGPLATPQTAPPDSPTCGRNGAETAESVGVSVIGGDLARYCWEMAFGSILPCPARLLVSAHATLWVYEGSMQ